MNERTISPATSQNRRDFLKTSSTVAAAMALGGLSIERSAYAAGSDQIKLALIGCGGRGSGAANQALSTEGDVKLIAMADAFPDRLKSSLGELQRAHKDRVDVPEDHQFIGFDAYKKAIFHAEFNAAPRHYRRVASTWRRSRMVQHKSERYVRLRAARYRGRLSSQDRGNQSAASKRPSSLAESRLARADDFFPAFLISMASYRPQRIHVRGASPLQVFVRDNDVSRHFAF